MKFTDWLVDKTYYYFQVWDYRYVLPAMARLPLPISELLVYLRGMFNALLDLDWRSLALRKRYVWENTYKAMQLMRPESNAWNWRVKTTWRYVHNAREEWEAAMFDRRDMSFLLKKSIVEGLEPLHAAQASGKGVLLLTAHYASFLTGVVIMGLSGLKIHVITSSVVEHPDVHIDVRRFYWRKYRGIERYLNGGKMVHYETSIKYFYRALEQGDIVVIVADLPGKPDSYTAVPFLGKPRKMAPGALRIARKTCSLTGAFSCVHQKTGQYHLLCSSLSSINADSTASTLAPAYDFLSCCINDSPEHWWASELMPNYQDAESTS